MKILSVTRAVPGKVVTNQDILAMLEDRIRARVDRETLAAILKTLAKSLAYVGAGTRYYRQPGDQAVEFGLAAGRQALASAELDPADIDLLLYVGVGRGAIEPATANVFQWELGCRRATCFDVLDACASWLRGMDIARHYLRGGTANHVMIVNCEFNVHEYANWDVRSLADLETSWAGYTIGEAATATILGPDPDGDAYASWFRTTGESYHLCRIPLPNADRFLRPPPEARCPPLKFYSDSPRLTRRTLALLGEQFRENRAIGEFDYDILLTHSASTRVSMTGIHQLGLDPSRFYDTFPRYGNTVSASLPLALACAIDDGALRRGGRVLMVMGSAGISTGVSAFTF
jgi:3-oxoacyl-[acyl-carrier-protein] synthase III